MVGAIVALAIALPAAPETIEIVARPDDGGGAGGGGVGGAAAGFNILVGAADVDIVGVRVVAEGAAVGFLPAEVVIGIAGELVVDVLNRYGLAAHRVPCGEDPEARVRRRRCPRGLWQLGHGLEQIVGRGAINVFSYVILPDRFRCRDCRNCRRSSSTRHRS